MQHRLRMQRFLADMVRASAAGSVQLLCLQPSDAVVLLLLLLQLLSGCSAGSAWLAVAAHVFTATKTKSIISSV
jgi:hypothetical protein